VVDVEFNERLVKICSEFCETPFFLFEKRRIRQNFQRISNSINKKIEIFYAVKANPHPGVINILDRCGSKFEIASANELKLLLDLGISVDKIIYSAPVKPRRHIEFAYKKGIKFFCFDCLSEVFKLAESAPETNVYLRLNVSNKGSEWPLSEKFGAEPEDALYLLREAQNRSLNPCGLMFHVGSQCMNVKNWEEALLICAEVYKEALNNGIKIEILNIGGGIPIQHTKKIPELHEIAEIINRLVEKLFPSDIKIFMEPGRALVGDACVLVTSIIGKAKRGQENWLYLDVGAFNGLMETIEKSEGFEYEICVNKREGKKKKFTLTGPTCDSGDTMFRGVFLPDLEIGDRIYIMNAGAYTLAYASNFNGFGPPEVHFVEEV
jgi:ornithine decarboxylase